MPFCERIKNKTRVASSQFREKEDYKDSLVTHDIVEFAFTDIHIHTHTHKRVHIYNSCFKGTSTASIVARCFVANFVAILSNECTGAAKEYYSPYYRTLSNDDGIF